MKDSVFAKDVDSGLSAAEKYLSSKYFYDDKGSRLFQQIMALPEYYLTKAEMNIMQTKSLEIYQAINSPQLDIIELGTGDGLKTIEFLRTLLAAKAEIVYHPIDISGEAIDQLKLKMSKALPELNIAPLVGDYFEKLSEIPATGKPKVVLFMGANIGNYLYPAAVDLLKHINQNINRGDMLLIGIDLQKDPNLIARAYNDSGGITRAFNLNLLTRINTELGGEFDLHKFDFYCYYDPIRGEIRSFLVSLANQEVFIRANDKKYHFSRNELIYTELSKKYTQQQIEQLAADAGFKCINLFHDDADYFADCLFEKMN
jgi:L-histidine Nalpha-methyltransferase